MIYPQETPSAIPINAETGYTAAIGAQDFNGIVVVHMSETQTSGYKTVLRTLNSVSPPRMPDGSCAEVPSER